MVSSNKGPGKLLSAAGKRFSSRCVQILLGGGLECSLLSGQIKASIYTKCEYSVRHDYTHVSAPRRQSSTTQSSLQSKRLMKHRVVHLDVISKPDADGCYAVAYS